ncbi:hypothetical protein KXD40_009691 [Peronospora effusa]|nr:hypothetical protein KXD40_009691 [Peronospora effusa]
MDAALPKCLIIMPEAKQTLTDLTDRIVSETLQTNENLYIDDRGLIGKKVKFCEQAHLKFAWTRAESAKIAVEQRRKAAPTQSNLQ